MKPRIVKVKIAIPEPCSTDPAYSKRALPPYVGAVESCGGEAVVIPLSLAPEEIARRITACSGVLLPGSKADVDPQKYGARQHPKTTAADPLRDAADELLLQDAYNMRKPVFGICYGLQSLNVWRTGSLVQDIESPIKHSAPREARIAHQVRIEPDSLLARALHATSGESTFPVNSSHHQAASTVGDGLVAVAHCPEDGIVEALEGTLPDHYVLAVQWHPERTIDSDVPSRLLFQSFVEAAAQWTRPARNGP
ncbi:MAG TPA: gamma-glutamyl-gamma-aminobutyrate hydrolase family protein [Verrucomicrobiae bacterium]|nr:gamma-glutamyl-gamma-aminobutyrate hydrolase family protein [Verrucomicrobiae bacterium]